MSAEMWGGCPLVSLQSRWSVRVRNGNVHMQYFCTIYTHVQMCVKKCHRQGRKNECLVGLQEGGVKVDQYRIMLTGFGRSVMV
jgi:hypothetical protein